MSSVAPAEEIPGEEAEYLNWIETELKPATLGTPGHTETRTYKLISHKRDHTNCESERERVWGQPPPYMNFHEFRECADLEMISMIPVKQWSHEFDEGRRSSEYLIPLIYTNG
jgi:hypothetical protein